MSPFIDVSMLLVDPMFAGSFSVVQRIQNTNDFGETNISTVQTDGVVGVITPTDSAELRRHPEVEWGERTITIYTQARLNMVAQGSPSGAQRQPDLVLWRGDRFIVKKLYPWTDYGPGWVKVLATSIDAVEAVT